MEILVRYKGSVVIAERVRVTVLPEYRTWQNLLARCARPASGKFEGYGSRGITLCARWQKFENFYVDMGPKPTEQHSVERKDNERGYEPDNCKWALIAEQSQNKRNTVWVVFEGKRQKLMAIVARLNLDRQMVHSRIKNGWPVEMAVKLPRYSHYKTGNDRRRKTPA